MIISGWEKFDNMIRSIEKEIAEEVLCKSMSDAFVKNSAYYKWEQRAREITKINRKLRLERNFIENNTEM